MLVFSGADDRQGEAHDRAGRSCARVAGPDLCGRVLAAADAERHRIERDLHDGAQQFLLVAALTARRVRQHPGLDPELTGHLDRLLDDLDRAMTGLRELAGGIFPAALTTHGIVRALEDASSRYPLTVRIGAVGIGRYSPRIEATVYFACQEALQNALKHAGPQARVDIQLIDTGSTLAFTVRDDGPGFPGGSVRPVAGHGLVNLADRLAAVDGALAVESAPGQGVTIHAVVPLRAELPRVESLRAKSFREKSLRENGSARRARAEPA